MSNCHILSITDSGKWNQYLKQLPIDQQDVYFTPEYYSLYEANGDGKALCFVFEHDSEIALYPFLINRINDLGYDLDDEYFDIQGAYGYNGVVSSSYNDDFKRLFHERFREYAVENNIVCEFLRVNPLLPNFLMDCGSYSFVRVNTTYATNLNAQDILYEEYEHSARKNINKAKLEGLDVVFYEYPGSKLDHLIEFLKIYEDTITRRSAEEYYFFCKDYFTALLGNPSIVSRLYFCENNGKKISTEIVLIGPKYAYSFLGGTLCEYFKQRPNDYLKHTIISDLKQIGLDRFVLGGGNEDRDGISRYKKSFAKKSFMDFYICYNIYNDNIYNSLLRGWEMRFPELRSKYGKRVLRYRETN